MHHSVPSFLLALTLAVASASGAGVQMTEVNTSAAGTSRSEMLMDGDRFKVTYVEAVEGMPAGCYILGNGPGKMFFVLPSRSAYTRFDAAEFSGMGQKHGQSGGEEEAGSGMKRTIQDVLLKKELDEAGPAMFGLSTRHYRYALSYKEVMKMTGSPMAMTNKVSETHEFWATTEIADAATINAWRANSPTMSGGGPVDEKTEAEKTMEAHGIRLKSIVTHKAVMGGMGGLGAMMGRGSKGDTDTTKREVVAFARVDIPAETFALPKGYEETDMMNLFAGRNSRMPDLNDSSGKPAKPRSAMPDLNSEPGR